MNVSGYSIDELNLFQTVLEAAQRELAESDMSVSLHLLTLRLFNEAQTGERRFDALKAVAMGDGVLPHRDLPSTLGTSPDQRL